MLHLLVPCRVLTLQSVRMQPVLLLSTASAVVSTICSGTDKSHNNAMQVITDPKAKDAALEALVEHIIPGRSADAVRPNNKSELVSTTIVSLSLDEASTKVRAGPPIDDKPDYNLDVWAGEVPLHQTVGEPIDDPKLKSGVPIPDYVANYSRHSS